MITVRRTLPTDWASLKTIRLAALLDAPTAFGIRYEQSAAQSDEAWQARAAGSSGPVFWLAFEGDEPIGMIGGAGDQAGRFHLLAMWVLESKRGSTAARQLVDAVKAHAASLGHERIFLDVAPENARAARFYQKQGFAFIDEWQPLASHPHIRVQTMEWAALAWQ